MLQVSSGLLSSLETHGTQRWIDFHVRKLSELLPDVRVMYSDEVFEDMVVRILMRAEAIPLVQENATIAFGYVSLTLGIGFEVEEPLRWVDEVQAAAPSEQADIIWDMLDDRLEDQATASARS